MSMKDIIKGHINEVLNKEGDLATARLSICKDCPLMKMKVYGAVCDSTTYLNPTTNETSYQKKDGFLKGCGCRLEAKTRLPDAKCPVGKW